MKRYKRIGLVAHDNRKKDLVEWVDWNWQELMNHELICTGTTGRLVEDTLLKKVPKEKHKPKLINRRRRMSLTI